MKLKSAIASFCLAMVGSVSWAFGPADLGKDIVDNSKITFLEKAQIGYGWDMSDPDSNGAQTALLGVYEYRFFQLNAGWFDPFSESNNGIPSILAGIHPDKIVRLIAPGMTETVRQVVPEHIRPLWDSLTISYGPGYDLNDGRWTHILALNLEFGG